MKNYYQGSSDHPYHLSVGAVLVNDKNEVCCHYFGDVLRRHKKFASYTDFYLLMRETMEMGEKIEETLHRGLMEEFGATGEIVDYLGSINNGWNSKDGVYIEKTTLYFQAKVISFKPELRGKEDPESESEIQWQPIDYLIPKMKEQAVRLGHATIDESGILERVKNIFAILTP